MERPKISQQVIDLFSSIVDSQDGKGIKKYNKTVDALTDEDYDYNRMALEEAVDALKYQLIENRKLKNELAKKVEDGYLSADLLAEDIHHALGYLRQLRDATEQTLKKAEESKDGSFALSLFGEVRGLNTAIKRIENVMIGK